MKIAVVGGGSIGSYLAGLLSLGGNDVHLLCRGAQLDAIRTHGLTIERGQVTRVAHQLQVTDDPSTIGAADVVLMCVKLFDLANTTRQVRNLIGPETLAIPIQNGVTAHEIIGREIGRKHAAGGTVFISASLERPGMVVSRSAVDQLIFGEVDAGSGECRSSFGDRHCT